jgi:hypothetical protein
MARNEETMIITFTWGHVNPKPGFVSAWDAARKAYGAEAFDALHRCAQIAAVREYMNR